MPSVQKMTYFPITSLLMSFIKHWYTEGSTSHAVRWYGMFKINYNKII